MCNILHTIGLYAYKPKILSFRNMYYIYLVYRDIVIARSFTYKCGDLDEHSGLYGGLGIVTIFYKNS